MPKFAQTPCGLEIRPIIGYAFPVPVAVAKSDTRMSSGPVNPFAHPFAHNFQP